jgi:hypothetical protein
MRDCAVGLFRLHFAKKSLSHLVGASSLPGLEVAFGVFAGCREKADQPHCEHISRARQAGSGILTPNRAAISAG